MKKMYLIALIGSDGDQEVKLVAAPVWEWINSQRPEELSVAGGAYEDVPAAALEAMPQRAAQCYVTSGSCENDRALFAGGETFSRIVDAFAWAKDNDVLVEDEYVGFIY